MTLSAWDENISVGLQEEELYVATSLGTIGGTLPLAPIPEDIPQPFGLHPLSAPGESASAVQHQEKIDLLAKLSDGRPLRGRPPPPLHGDARLPHGRDPSSLATPKGSSLLKVGEVDWSSPGVTQRGSRTRPGIDRWHNLDGSIRYRLREQQSQAAEHELTPEPRAVCPEPGQANSPPNPLPAADSSGSLITGREETPAEGPVTSFYADKTWKVHDDDVSTCDPGRAEGVTSSDSSSCSEVGFWKNGVWQPRARTAQEARQHRGGGGPQRMMRKQLRMHSYMQGTWRPAWLEHYVEDKKRRQEAVPEQVVPDPAPASTPPPPEATHLTDPDPWGASWRNGADYWWSASAWGASSWNTSSWLSTSWSWSTSSTTTMEPAIQEQEDFPPNFGLFPNVGPALPPTPPNPWLLQLTGAERRLLQEGGVPELPIERIDLLLECLEDHQAADHGPEARWALARLVRRLEEAQGSLQVVLEVLARRLRPRGYLPITRVPHARAEQVRLLNWMVNSAAFVAETLEFHLRTPLQPDETSLAAGPRASPPPSPLDALVDERTAATMEAEDAAASSSSSHDRYPTGNHANRTRSRSPPPRSSGNASDYVMETDAFGLDICLLPTLQEEGHELISDGMQRALDGELLGIWQEPDQIGDDVTVDATQLTISSSSTTTSSASWSCSPSTTTLRSTSGTTASWTPTSWTTSSWTTTGTSSWATSTGVNPSATPFSTMAPSSGSSSSPPSLLEYTVPSPEGEYVTTVASSSSSLLLESVWSLWDGLGPGSTTPDAGGWTSTTTSTSRSSLDVVGNNTADLRVFANTADVVDTLHRLLARSRALVRSQRLSCGSPFHLRLRC